MSKYARKVDTNQADLAARLEAAGWLIVDLSRMGFGWPDILAIRAAQYLWIEFKNPERSKGRRAPSTQQLAKHALLRMHGAEVRVVLTAEDVAPYCAEQVKGQ